MPPSAQEFDCGGRRLALVAGDITQIPADAIGNAANPRLAGGGGVDGAIHRAGGPSIMQELDDVRTRVGRCPPGHVVVTGAGNLPARYILHAVGPVYRGGTKGEPRTLAACYGRCLKLATELGARSMTLPAISTGVYGYPLDEAAEIAVRAVAEFLAADATTLEKVTFVLFDDLAFSSFATAARKILMSGA